jgi:hypothetical protein
LRGSSKVADTVIIRNMRADFQPDETILTLDTVTQITLPLNPNPITKSTTYTFEIDNVQHTFTLGYTTAVLLTHKVCGQPTIFSKLVLNASDFAAGTSVINITRDGVSFPAVNNVEIVKQN